jgi:NadR type nicotinamide-nucleotide adenylyltransferase
MINNDKQLIRIAITGPESTGKSTLSEALARYYKTVFVSEYAREYIDQLDRDYSFDDILAIARGQLKREQELAAKGNKFIFCDTELIVTRIWSLHRYGKCHDWIDEQIAKRRYDLYLLCNVDLPLGI